MVLSMDRWIGKVAIVTGASSGIGAAIVEKLVEEGMIVVGLARRIDRMEEAARKLTGKRGILHPLKCDISEESDILEAFSYIKNHLGLVHVLKNNAGIAKISSLMDDETEMWKQILNVNILGLCICTREAIKVMRENNIDGHIVHMNSVTGHRVPTNFPVNLYPATKFAVGALAETLRYEFNSVESRIKITSLSPGIVMTEIFDSSGMSYKTLKEGIGGNLPYLDSEDIADSIVYILSTPPNVMVTELTLKPLHETI
ncbi:hypothetical protein JTB14_027152 [Gonioctena quinquepunctata]|nr:hypothetical protein JTB14_027152 [Gonioctena quinquepunctata]